MDKYLKVVIPHCPKCRERCFMTVSPSLQVEGYLNTEVYENTLMCKTCNIVLLKFKLSD